MAAWVFRSQGQSCNVVNDRQKDRQTDRYIAYTHKYILLNRSNAVR